jgi:hypothetical protein
MHQAVVCDPPRAVSRKLNEGVNYAGLCGDISGRGNAHVDDLLLLVHGLSRDRLAGDGGIIGTPFMKTFRMTISYRHRALLLAR